LPVDNLEKPIGCQTSSGNVKGADGALSLNLTNPNLLQSYL